jgi:hypothetical protein
MKDEKWEDPSHNPKVLTKQDRRRIRRQGLWDIVSTLFSTGPQYIELPNGERIPQHPTGNQNY